MNLVLADVDNAGLEKTAAACRDVQVAIMRVDVADPADVDSLADLAFQRFGRVDLLCNNAGVVPGGRHRHVWQYSANDWHWAFGVNVVGLANGARSFVPRMIEAGHNSHIMNTTSVSGFISGAGSPVYGASKHAAVRLTEALYASLLDIGAPIGVSMLCPGLVNTQIFASERVRPANLESDAANVEEPDGLHDIAASGIDPDEVARMAFAGVENGQFYIFSTNGFDTSIADRTATILSRQNPSFESFGVMSRKG